MRKKLITLIILGIGVMGAQVVTAQTVVDATASWSAPTEGSPVVHYVVQISQDGGPFTAAGTTNNTFVTLQLQVGSTYTVRVAGVDAQSRQGPFSEPSDPYTPAVGPPGQPGKPIIL